MWVVNNSPAAFDQLMQGRSRSKPAGSKEEDSVFPRQMPSQYCRIGGAVLPHVKI
jgi:hypothetical protein